MWRRLLTGALVVGGLTLLAFPVEAQEAAPASGERVPVPAMSEKARAYYTSGNVLWVIGQVGRLLGPLLLVVSGFSARLRDWALRRSRRRAGFHLTYFTGLVLLLFLLSLPWSYYTEFVREHAYGLSNQTFGKWCSDTLLGAAIAWAVALGPVLGLYRLLRVSPRRWWLWAGLVSLPFIFLTTFLEPLLIDPLFNQFGPMKDAALEQQILALAQRAGIEGSRVFEVEKSVDTKELNAYVTGFAGSKRIVLWDTIIARLRPPELLVVMAHEMGHFVLGHVLWGLAGAALLTMTTLGVVQLVAGSIVERFEFGFRRLSDIASLPLLVFVGSAFLFVVNPVVLAVSRDQEHEADRFALELTRDNHAAALAFATLQNDNLGNPRPGPLYHLLRASHPSLGERIDFCNDYRPWETGAPLRYGRYFAPAQSNDAAKPGQSQH